MIEDVKKQVDVKQEFYVDSLPTELRTEVTRLLDGYSYSDRKLEDLVNNIVKAVYVIRACDLKDSLNAIRAFDIAKRELMDYVKSKSVRFISVRESLPGEDIPLVIRTNSGICLGFRSNGEWWNDNNRNIDGVIDWMYRSLMEGEK